MKKKSLVAKKKIHNSLLNYLKDNKVKKVFEGYKNYLNKFIKNKVNIGVAISGGPDSLALSFLTKCFILLNNNVDSKFFIVDHKLRKESSKEAKSIKLLLKKFDIECKILNWNGKKPKSNIQGIARNERYNLLKSACKRNSINILLIGHHIDDLYENFFIRLLRGSGLKGLSSFGEPIKEDNFFILRPLIKFYKDDLTYISKLVFNFYIQDPSNQDFFYQRSRIRKLIFDLRKEGFDKKKLDLTIKNLKIANDGIDFYVEKNVNENSKLIADKKIYILNKHFFKQSEEVIFRSISSILKKISNRYYPPRGKSISNLILKINSKKIKKVTLGGCFVEKVNETVFISREN
tara:strand:+ start:937 stop:1980 length:1044 start_codon:yes stop_codon:yes gene_type:complete